MSPRGRLVPGGGKQVDVVDQLVACQPAPIALLVDVLGVEQLGDDVVRRVPGAPVDVVGDGAQLLLVLGLGDGHVRHRVAVFESQAVVDQLTERLQARVGEPEEHGDHMHGHLRPEIGDKVEPVGAYERVETPGAEVADPGFEVVDLPGSEDP